ncbi:protein PTST homolog 2, chloroplastic isoform X2 [Beta vulgaris subsp. vulgaris]|uniref:protein PTST homolog 2, chloroplastic isoform X2 n=1 Tax=Beta vulgaris subsp. vulgaris TaxID=3555 RepID=UPI000900A6A2|nr:protein PTST homolog 2, chloroplastic isoform X2 [Beta vulgaris subsp. vulgaris]
MFSLIAATSVDFKLSYQPISYLNSPSFFPIVLVISPLKRHHPLRSKRKHLKQKKQNQFLFEFSGFSGSLRMCKSWEGEGDPALELEVLEFMKFSKNPQKFPSKRELIDAGRMDLVELIMKKGGWMTIGWGDEDEREISEDGLGEFCLEKYGKNGSEGEKRCGSESNEERHIQGTNFLGNSSQAASSSGRSVDLPAEDDNGIEGILRRLEKHRNLSFGFKLGRNSSTSGYVNGKSGDNNQNERIRKDVAGEIDFGAYTKQGIGDELMSEIVAVTTDIRGAQDETKDLVSYNREIIQGDLKNRLQHLEVELSSALRSLRSNISELSGKAKEHLPEDLSELSDVSEFQETEIMNAQDKLRTLRAKLAVLDGKMSLAIMDAQKILDEKQKRIDDARRALQLLRTTCIVWPNSGSEVLLAGSFDGWATQRKMTRSSTGIFSVCLKLYPGKYEIKFIVDGVWKVDPLRPIVNNNGFENNLLTIT